MPIETAPRARLLARLPVLARLRQASSRLLERLRPRAPSAGSRDMLGVRVVGSRPTASAAARGTTSAGLLAPMDADRLREARRSMRRILDCHPAAPVIWPSIALVDRSLARHGALGIERLSPQVLQDATRVLNRLMDDLCEHGIIVLLERIDRVLRVVHRCAPAADAPWQAVRPDEIQVLESTITEFMEIERAWDEQGAAGLDCARPALAA